MKSAMGYVLLVILHASVAVCADAGPGDALAVVEACLDDPGSATEHVRGEAISSYVRLKGKDSIPKLLEVLAREPSAKLRFRILSRGDGFWAGLKESPDAIVELALEDEDHLVVRAALRALVEVGDERALAAIKKRLKACDEKARCSILSRLGRSKRRDLDALVAFLEDFVDESPRAVFSALDGASDPRHRTVQPRIADMAARLLPLMPPDEKHKPFEFIGKTGALRHLSILDECDKPELMRKKYGEMGDTALRRLSSAKANGMHSIIRRDLPRKTRLLVTGAADAAVRGEFVDKFHLFWQRLGALPDVLRKLTGDELKRAILAAAARSRETGPYTLYDTLAAIRRRDAVPILCTIYERHYEKGGEAKPDLRYLLQCLVKTEQREAAEFICEKWLESCDASSGVQRANEAALFSALMMFKTSVAEDATLMVLDHADVRRRYIAVRQLGRIGTEKAHWKLTRMPWTEPNVELGRGGCIVEMTHDVLRRSIAQIRARLGLRAYLRPACWAAALVALAAAALVLWTKRKSVFGRGTSAQEPDGVPKSPGP